MAYERDPGEMRPRSGPYSILIWLPLAIAALVVAGLAAWFGAAYVVSLADRPTIDAPAIMPDPTRIPPQQPVPQ